MHDDHRKEQINYAIQCEARRNGEDVIVDVELEQKKMREMLKRTNPHLFND
jgi:hypothetical protein